MWFVNIFFWLQAFVAPVILFGIIAFLTNAGKLFIPLLIIGALVGIVIAEYIRRKIGLDIFFARIYGPNQMDDNKKEK
jgi:energy-converting hydrogenase Eha subunit A